MKHAFAYHNHSPTTCTCPDSFTYTTTSMKCGVKTSSGEPERYILIAYLEHSYPNWHMKATSKKTQKLNYSTKSEMSKCYTSSQRKLKLLHHRPTLTNGCRKNVKKKKVLLTYMHGLIRRFC